MSGRGKAAAATPAPEQSDERFYEIETKYIFGFTEGSGIGLEGEKEFSPESVIALGKRDGRYFASQTKLEYEFTPNQYVQFEFGPIVSSHYIQGVSDFEDRNQVTLGGAFAEIRYLLLERSSSSPLSITLSAEPEWHRVDETAGERVSSYALETKINGDLELIKNRLFFGFNLLYEPEVTRDDAGVWERESTIGISGALAFRVLPRVTVGAEIWYLRHYDGIALDTFTGDAVFLGPNIHMQLSPKMFVSAAWNTQVAGRDMENPGAALNLSEFSRHRAKLKLAVEF